MNSPNVTRVLWRIGFSHLADEEVDPNQARRFYCPECPSGDLILRHSRGEGWFLACNSCARTSRRQPQWFVDKARLSVSFACGCGGNGSQYVGKLSILEGV